MAAASSDDPGPPGEKRFEIKKWSAVGPLLAPRQRAAWRHADWRSMQGSTASTGATGNGNVRTEDEGARCPFLLEHDDSKIVICMCNYYSLGQAELARALLQIIASRNLAKALFCIQLALLLVAFFGSQMSEEDHLVLQFSDGGPVQSSQDASMLLRFYASCRFRARLQLYCSIKHGIMAVRVTGRRSGSGQQEKAIVAAERGYCGLVVFNRRSGVPPPAVGILELPDMTAGRERDGNVAVPAWLVSKEDGLALLAALASGTLQAEVIEQERKPPLWVAQADSFGIRDYQLVACMQRCDLVYVYVSWIAKSFMPDDARGRSIAMGNRCSWKSVLMVIETGEDRSGPCLSTFVRVWSACEVWAKETQMQGAGAGFIDFHPTAAGSTQRPPRKQLLRFALVNAGNATTRSLSVQSAGKVQQCPLQQVPFTQAQMVQPRHGAASPTASQGSLHRAPRLSWPPSSQGHPSVPSTPCTPSPKPLPCQGSQTSRTSREGAPTRLASSQLGAMSPSRPAVQGQGMLSSPPSRSDILSDGSEVPSRKTLPSGVRLQVSTQEDPQHGLQVQSVMVTKRNERSTEDLQKEVAILTNLLHQERRQANDAFNKLHNKWSCDLRANEDFIKYLHNEKDRMQQKLEGLENERKGVIAQWQQLVAENEDLRKELRSKNRQLEGENSELKEALTKLQNRLEELNSFENFADGELEDARAKVANMAHELEGAQNQVAKLQKENASLQKQVEVQRKLREDEQRASEEKNRRWARECSGVGAGTGEEAAQSPATPELATSSENRLRMAMIDSSSSSAQLKDAISAVESLLGEAKREMKNKQLRERRAAFEQLHAALEANDEHALAQAVEAARMAEVEAEDVAKAEAGACDANRQPNGKHCRTLHSSMDFLLSRRHVGDRSSWLMA
ncbi:unnamed protein product [Symbiodinium sp. CCMP2592]|nr:unnamed protein product [Symbiodinium sp. CCMP2592]